MWHYRYATVITQRKIVTLLLTGKQVKSLILVTNGLNI